MKLVFSIFRTGLLSGVLILLLIGCAEKQGDEQLRKKAQIEGEESAQKQQQAENGTRVSRATEMERDLAQRQRFYQALKGVYQGKLSTEVGEFNVRFTFAPSLPPYPTTGRTRDIGEIEADLTNLYFNIQVVQWNPENNLGAVGCRVQGVRPDLNTGEIIIAAQDCPNAYAIYISQKSSNSDPTAVSKSMTTAILAGKSSSVSRIVGQIKPTNNASVYQFYAERTKK
jgi:hypothetical protein